MLDNCGKAYRSASDKIKRLMNQAIFEKVYVISNEDIPLGIESEYRSPFDSILVPTNISGKTEDSSVAKSRILVEPGCGHFADNSTFIRNYSKFFKDKISSNKLLVESGGLEPSTFRV